MLTEVLPVIKQIRIHVFGRQAGRQADATRERKKKGLVYICPVLFQTHQSDAFLTSLVQELSERAKRGRQYYFRKTPSTETEALEVRSAFLSIILVINLLACSCILPSKPGETNQVLLFFLSFPRRWLSSHT